MAKITCYYCDRYQTSKQISSLRRYCDAMKKYVRGKRKICKKYFTPMQKPFYCQKNQIFLDLMQCIGRRRNRLNLKAWENCAKCRQFEKEIQPIIQEYWIEAKPIKDPESKRKIKRLNRNQKKKLQRTIKRQSKPTEANPRRKIKRRKPKRKIRRRKNA